MQNPYSAPQTGDDTSLINPPQMLGVLLYAVGLGSLIGMITSFINGWLGPAYFHYLMNWNDSIIIRAVIQGAIEGAIYGGINGFVLGGVVFFWCGGIANPKVLKRYVLMTAIAVSVIWLVGGILGILLLPMYAKNVLGPPTPFPQHLAHN
ncbi:MAG: hypothetical protein SFX18_06535 [Pirellulales bacterium]|nr:hypothetical protein [Pirellulales bacterium]